MPGSWTTPSGSRWEPEPDHVAGVPRPPVTAPTATGPATDEPLRVSRRSRRGPALVALVALLGLGGLGGAYAYEHPAGGGAPTTATAGGADQAPAGDARGPHPENGDVRPHDRSTDRGRGPGTDGDR